MPIVIADHDQISIPTSRDGDNLLRRHAFENLTVGFHARRHLTSQFRQQPFRLLTCRLLARGQGYERRGGMNHVNQLNDRAGCTGKRASHLNRALSGLASVYRN